MTSTEILLSQKNAHYLIGGSDTHDVPSIRAFADEKLQNTKRSSTDYVSGKIGTYAYVGETTDSIMETVWLTGKQLLAVTPTPPNGPLPRYG